MTKKTADELSRQIAEITSQHEKNVAEYDRLMAEMVAERDALRVKEREEKIQRDNARWKRLGNALELSFGEITDEETFKEWVVGDGLTSFKVFFGLEEVVVDEEIADIPVEDFTPSEPEQVEEVELPAEVPDVEDVSAPADPDFDFDPDETAAVSESVVKPVFSPAQIPAVKPEPRVHIADFGRQPMTTEEKPVYSAPSFSFEPAGVSQQAVAPGPVFDPTIPQGHRFASAAEEEDAIVELATSEEFDVDQMQFILFVAKQGLSYDDTLILAKPEYPVEKMRELYTQLKENYK